MSDDRFQPEADVWRHGAEGKSGHMR